jgi:hypothetical protein
MDSGQLTAVLIVGIVMIASIFRARIRGPYRHRGSLPEDGHAHLENQRLREEVGELKERLKVLERIAVDKENSLARQIDELRDH